MGSPDAHGRTRPRYLRTTLLVFAVAVAVFVVSAVVFDRQMDAGKELRDAILPFAALILACAAIATCGLVFVKDVVRNRRLSGQDWARWLGGFGLFPPLVFLYGWRHARR